MDEATKDVGSEKPLYKGITREMDNIAVDVVIEKPLYKGIDRGHG